jgi:hypothetical protein
VLFSCAELEVVSVLYPLYGIRTSPSSSLRLFKDKDWSMVSVVYMGVTNSFSVGDKRSQ